MTGFGDSVTVAGTSFSCGCAAVSALASWRSCASEVSDASASSGLSPCLQAPSASVTVSRTGVAIPFELEAGRAAYLNSTDGNARPARATYTARDRERHPLVDHNRTTSTTSISARIAVVDISDNSAANNGA